MPDWSLLGGGARYEASGLTGSEGVLVTASGSANTKGSYAELIAAVSVEVVALDINLRMTTTNADSLIDIAVGAAGSEQDIISNVLVGGRQGIRTDKMWVPIRIPNGTRISARIQSSTGSSAISVGIVVWGQSFPPSSPLGRITTYGADTIDSGGVSVDPGAVANTKGAYSEVVASTGNEIKMLWMSVGEQANIARTGGDWAFDIAVGAGTSEQIVVPDLLSRLVSTTDSFHGRVYGPYPVQIPSGTRLAVRAQSSVTDATDRLVDVVLYGAD